jgi:hypothetical protein
MLDIFKFPTANGNPRKEYNSNVELVQMKTKTAHIIIFITLTQIWKAHFRFIFDETPFHSPNIIASITEDITQWRKEALVHRRR